MSMEFCYKHSSNFDTDFDLICPECSLEAYKEGYDAYYSENTGNGRWERADNPYNGLDEDLLFDAWASGYAQAGWDD